MSLSREKVNEVPKALFYYLNLPRIVFKENLGLLAGTTSFFTYVGLDGDCKSCNGTNVNFRSSGTHYNRHSLSFCSSYVFCITYNCTTEY